MLVEALDGTFTDHHAFMCRHDANAPGMTVRFDPIPATETTGGVTPPAALTPLFCGRADSSVLSYSNAVALQCGHVVCDARHAWASRRTGSTFECPTAGSLRMLRFR